MFTCMCSHSLLQLVSSSMGLCPAYLHSHIWHEFNYVNMYAHGHVHAFIYVRVRLCMLKCVCTHTHLCVRVHLCALTCICP